MKKRRIAIYDEEPDYTQRFAQYANRQGEQLFIVHGYSNEEDLIQDAKENPVDILLVSKSYVERLGKEQHIGQIICLSEEEYQEENPEYPEICKYQSCQQILKRAYAIYADRVPVSLGVTLRLGGMKRLGVFSPLGRMGKTSFALALGKELAKQRRTLYLNMEEFSGFETLYPCEDGHTLSELIYFMKQGKKAFACKLESMIGKMGSLNYIPPVKLPIELKDIKRKDWEELLLALEKESQYEFAILDLSFGVEGLFELLEGCDRIYMPITSDETAQAKLWQYQETLRLLDLEEILEKTEKVTFSDLEAIEEYARREGGRWSKI